MRKEDAFIRTKPIVALFGGHHICDYETHTQVMSGDIKFECQPLHGTSSLLVVSLDECLSIVRLVCCSCGFAGDIPQKQRETTIAGFKRGGNSFVLHLSIIDYHQRYVI